MSKNKIVLHSNKSKEQVVEALNSIVRPNIDIRDKWGKTPYLFWGKKITEEKFLWQSALHVNNLYKIKGEIVSADDGSTKVQIEVVGVLIYIIYALVLFAAILGFFIKNYYAIIFGVLLGVVALLDKQNYIDSVVKDIKEHL